MKKYPVSAIFVILLLFSCFQDDYTRQRHRMVDEQIESRGVTHEATLEAMRNVPRHRFVPEPMQAYAYDDRPLSIGHSQTISQPYIVGLMTASVEPDADDKVLEIGTGSGYQAAILSEIVKEVYTIEIVPALASRAKRVFYELKYENIHAMQGDGYAGWPSEAPFDAIIVTAAPEEVPQPLLDQLKEGGKMIVPVGPISRVQVLKLITKKNGKIKERDLLPVRFVPFTGDGAN